MRHKIPKLYIILCIIMLAGAAAYSLAYKYRHQGDYIPPKQNSYQQNNTDQIKENYVLINVPFTSQAPLADWADPRHQDGCEEASILMAWLWINNKTMTKDEAEVEIENIADFELDRYGNFHDTNAADTVQVMKDYYSYQKISFSLNPTIEDIKNALRERKLVLVPANGKKLGNPNFRNGGPLTHMLVLKGFDDSKNQFITNDPGTRLGEGYVYDYQTVYNAMVDYPTGQHLSQEGQPKSMIVVQK